MSHARFTIDGDEALEQRLAASCSEIGERIRDMIPHRRLQALVLGGGYGRGEGGVWQTGAGHQPYNDLEFFLFIQGHPRLNERRYRAAIHALEHDMTRSLGIDVEFKILSLDQFRRSATTMFYYDLVCGHRMVVGPDDFFASCSHHAEAARIPQHEATRLLMNRSSGLLFAAEKIAAAHRDAAGHRDDEDLQFIVRNIHKAKLAVGDAILAAHGQYHWSCRERQQRLAQIDIPTLPMEALIQCHAEGVKFKLQPSHQQSSTEELRNQHEHITQLAWKVWQWLEQQRLGFMASSPADYANSINKCPESPALKNLLLRLKSFGPRGIFSKLAFRYPRESLLNSLPLLLLKADEISSHTDWLSQQLGARITTREEALEAYRILWNQYN